MRGYRINSIGSLFLEDAKTEELDKGVEFGFSKTLRTAVSSHLICIAVLYLNVLVLEAFTHKIATNINVF
jgi:hypothetical protein